MDTFTTSKAALLQPARLTPQSAWIGHIPFAGWLIKEFRPRVLVELGTHAGDSYLAFCQALREHDVDAKCYAVDTWQGDEHAGFYAEQIYLDLYRYHQERYAAFSQLLRMTFDDARTYFGPDSVDLLHIDGLHTYDAVKHDFETWLPTMTSRGIVLFHDINVHEREFGVWQLWAEISKQYPSFEFTHAHGLGVLLVGSDYAGPERPELLRRLDESAPIFPRLGERLVWARRVQTREEEIGELRQKVEAAEKAAVEHEAVGSYAKGLEVHVANLDARIGDLQGQLAETERQRDKVELQCATLDPHIRNLTRIVADQAANIGRLERSLAEREAALADTARRLNEESAAHGRNVWTLQHEIAALRGSTSWKITAPVRWSGRKAKGLKRRVSTFAALAGHAREVGYAKTLTHIVTAYRQDGIRGIRTGMARAHLRTVGPLGEVMPAPVATPWQPQRLREVRRHDKPVDIVVCVHNALDDVARCLESVARHTFPPYRLIIVDDGSEAPTREYLENFVLGQPATLIRHDEAKGYTLAANVGMRASTAEYLVLLNSDTVVSPFWLDRLVECAESDLRIGAVGPVSNTASWQSVPRIFDADGDWADNALPEGWTVADFAEQLAQSSSRVFPQVGFLNGFCMLITRRMRDQLGLFDEETFARGYGEENDYCLRAVAAGWRLAIADDAYVFHAQSKSYSHERRQALVEAAGKALEAKHPRASIDAQLHMTCDHLALFSLRHRAQIIDQRLAWRERAARHAGKRVLFLLPSAGAGGGSNVVVTEARAMRALGVDAIIANVEHHRHLFAAGYPNLDIPVIYLKSGTEPFVSAVEGLDKVARDFDAVIATAFHTVDWMHDLAGGHAALGYYIQDYEPDFFEQGSERHKQAVASYQTIPGLKMFTKTRWNRQTLADRLGAEATEVGPSYDWDLFHPDVTYVEDSAAVRIVAMVRPATPRRGPAITMEVLRRLKQKFGPRVAITIFGTQMDDPRLQALPHDFEFACAGEQPVEGVAHLLRHADLFLDLSVFQAMGLTAMEAMASGAAVIGPAGSGLEEVIVHEENGLLIDTQDVEACTAAAERVVGDVNFRNKLRRNGFDVARFHPEASAARILDVLFPEES